MFGGSFGQTGGFAAPAGGNTFGANQGFGGAPATFGGAQQQPFGQQPQQNQFGGSTFGAAPSTPNARTDSTVAVCCARLTLV